MNLKRSALLNNDQQLIDEEFQLKIKEYSSDVIKWWKDNYNYSSNDGRFLTATETQIYSDYLDAKLRIYIREIGIGTELERVLKGRISDPQFDAKENEAFGAGLKNIKIIKNAGL